jgi:molybdopterin adenylyltransferase
MEKLFTVFSLNVSQAKGTAKSPVDSVRITSSGIETDAHSGNWHRQVSLLDNESIAEFASVNGFTINPGDFGENITTEGIDISLLVAGSIISGPGNLRLEVAQVGKECHGDKCTIYRKVGTCIMPARGVFCRVLTPGYLHRGDILSLLKKNNTLEN